MQAQSDICSTSKMQVYHDITCRVLNVWLSYENLSMRPMRWRLTYCHEGGSKIKVGCTCARVQRGDAVHKLLLQRVLCHHEGVQILDRGILQAQRIAAKFSNEIHTWNNCQALVWHWRCQKGRSIGTGYWNGDVHCGVTGVLGLLGHTITPQSWRILQIALQSWLAMGESQFAL